MIENIFTLLMLIVLQLVLGLDNLLYISLESQRAPKEKQAYVRNLGITIAIALRIILLFVLVSIIQYVQDPIISFNWGNVISANFNIHSLIVLFGGGFIMYTATKEVMHMMRYTPKETSTNEKTRSIGNIITWIVIMNLVFSFDSILSAMALTEVFWIMAVAIVIGGVLMIWLSGRVAAFLQKNRMYEVLGLFILLVVGIMLITEGGHIGHLELFGNEITPMSKTTFYFVIAILAIIDVVQSKYQKNLEKEINDQS